MTYAVLAQHGDADAEPLARALARRAAGVVLVWDDELFLGSHFAHRLGPGGVESELVCADGRRLSSASLRGVANRLTHVLPPQFAGAAAADREYAAMETQALLVSWLSSLACPVVNAASPRGLSGPALGLHEWTARAAAAGLRCSPLALDAAAARPPAASLRRLLVVGPRVIGAEVGAGVASACALLARGSGCAVLGVDLAGEGAEPVFAAADPVPRLGPEGAEAVAELLAGGAP